MAAGPLRFSPHRELSAAHLTEICRSSADRLAGIRFPSAAGKTPFSSSAASTPFPLRLRYPYTLSSSDLPLIGGGGGGRGNLGGGRRGSGGAGHGDGHHGGGVPENPSDPAGPLGLFLVGWRSRVAADPQFPFKVLMEELVGVSACVLGDMASRPNFGLNELDFVFSTLVVGSILNFVLMYLLAPTAAASSAASAAVSALPSYMFEPGPYSLLARLATVFSKGVTFGAVGFGAGLAGTALSNGLISLRKKMDPAFETPNKPPPTLLNSVTWALHMGISSNLRYQTLNGIEYAMAKALPPAGFKVSVVLLRCLNNVLGGMSFVLLARLTGAQKAAEEKGEEKERLIDDKAAVTAAAAVGTQVGDGYSPTSESSK